MPTKKETRASELRRIRSQRDLQLHAVVRFCALNNLSRADLERMAYEAEWRPTWQAVAEASA